jgi:hypothetical protein
LRVFSIILSIAKRAESFKKALCDSGIDTLSLGCYPFPNTPSWRKGVGHELKWLDKYLELVK